MESLFTETIESIYPMNNVAYHFIKKVDFRKYIRNDYLK